MQHRAIGNGFTLLEMLVAMALMSMLAAAIYGSTTIAFRGRRAAERGLEPARRSSAAIRMLQADLESAVGAAGLLAGPFVGEDADGRDGEPADAVTFHSLSRDQALGDPPSAIVRLEVLLAEDDETGEMMLVRRTTRNLLAPEEPDAVQQTLCRRVRSFDVAYFDGTSWQASWDSTTRGDVLPIAVELTLALDVSTDGDGEDYEPEEDDYRLTTVLAVPCGDLPEEGQGAAGLGGEGLGGGPGGAAGGGGR